MVTEPQKKQRLVLIDGHSLVYRAFFALPSLTDREGNIVNAAYGFTSMLLLALQEHPDYVLASFDLGGRTFRHEALEQYKAARRPTPPELSPQFPLTRDIVRAFGIPIYEVQGVEADDVIGTLATQARERGLHSTIVTGDLDALQLVNDDVDVLTSKRGVSETILYTPDRVRQRYGLEPLQTVDLKGLVGDVSDNIPGIRGIGEKTAIKLIQEFDSVESLVENLEQAVTLAFEDLELRVRDELYVFLQQVDPRERIVVAAQEKGGAADRREVLRPQLVGETGAMEGIREEDEPSEVRFNCRHARDPAAE